MRTKKEEKDMFITKVQEELNKGWRSQRKGREENWDLREC